MPRSVLLIVLTILFFMPACKNAGIKYFSGTIEYAYTYSSNMLNGDSLTKARPAKGIFRYDENNYQNRFIDGDTITYYYSGPANKCIVETGSTKNTNAKIIVKCLIQYWL